MYLVRIFFFSRINDVKISRQGFEKRVVSQDLQLWLSNVSEILYDLHVFLSFNCDKSYNLSIVQCFRYHQLVINLPSLLGQEDRYFSWLSLFCSVPLSDIEKSFFLRCKKYNFLPHLIKRELKGHCREC